MAKKRPICLSCNSYCVSWGKTTSGKKRFRCPRCFQTRGYHITKSKTDFFALFRQYVFWGHTYEQVSDQSGYSIQYLSIQFHIFLKQLPPVLPIVPQVSAFLLVKYNIKMYIGIR